MISQSKIHVRFDGVSVGSHGIFVDVRYTVLHFADSKVSESGPNFEGPLHVAPNHQSVQPWTPVTGVR